MNSFGKNIIKSIYSKIDQQTDSKPKIIQNDENLEESLKESLSFFG